MGALALMLFVALYGFGAQVMGLPSANGQVQLALFLSFLLGIICGYRTGK